MLETAGSVVGVAVSAVALIGAGWAAALRFNGYVRRDQCHTAMGAVETKIMDLGRNSDASFRRVHERLDELAQSTARIRGWVEAQWVEAQEDGRNSRRGR